MSTATRLARAAMEEYPLALDARGQARYRAALLTVAKWALPVPDDGEGDGNFSIIGPVLLDALRDREPGTRHDGANTIHTTPGGTSIISAQWIGAPNVDLVAVSAEGEVTVLRPPVNPAFVRAVRAAVAS